jgi:hypothetical protein
MNSQYFNTTIKDEESSIYYKKELTPKRVKKPMFAKKVSKTVKNNKKSIEFSSDPKIKAKFDEQVQKFTLNKELYYQ